MRLMHEIKSLPAFTTYYNKKECLQPFNIETTRNVFTNINQNSNNHKFLQT